MLRRRELPPIGKPKYTKETFPTLQLNTDAASHNHESGMLTPTNILLLKFTFKPDIASKIRRAARRARTFAQLCTPDNNVSSAN
jgi:hypothetical protein